jgi:hypothetical protein
MSSFNDIKKRRRGKSGPMPRKWVPPPPTVKHKIIYTPIVTFYEDNIWPLELGYIYIL